MDTGKSSKGHEWKVTSSLSAMAEARGDRKASDGAGVAGGEYRLNREGYLCESTTISLFGNADWPFAPNSYTGDAADG